MSRLLIEEIPHNAIDENYYLRDRVSSNDSADHELRTSIKLHIQKMPIEVVQIAYRDAHRRYGLVSGYRRLQAIRFLQNEGYPEFNTIKACVLPHDHRSALIAQAIENDVRKDISPFERAFFVHRAAGTEAFSNVVDVIAHMYQHASASKISKIMSSVKLVDFIGDLVVHKNCIQEATGLRLVRYLEAGAGDLKLQRMLREASIDRTSEEELGLLNTYLKEAKPLYERQTGNAAHRAGVPSGLSPKMEESRFRKSLLIRFSWILPRRSTNLRRPADDFRGENPADPGKFLPVCRKEPI